MSWELSFGDSDTASFEMHAHDAFNAEVAKPPADQFEVATRAAQAIIDSGAAGDGLARLFVVTMSGHANPGHEQRAGWANDTVTVTVRQQ